MRLLTGADAALTLRWRLSERAALLNRGAETVDEQRQWIETRPKSEFNYIIETKAGFPLGTLSLVSVDLRHRHGESARFLIGEEREARSIPAAVEAMKLLYQFAFEILKLERVYGFVVSGNTMMLKWQKYFGMKEEGRLRKHLYFGGKPFDSVCVGILADEYRAVALPRLNALLALPSKTAGEVPSKGNER